MIWKECTQLFQQQEAKDLWMCSLFSVEGVDIRAGYSI
jgi:hypothetical protein